NQKRQPVHLDEAMTTLAITQAAAYINRRGRVTASGYLEEMRKNSKKDESASNLVVTTWQMSFERIREERPSAADLLSLMSYFNPQGIPESILRKHSRTVARAGCEDEADDAFDEDLVTLQAYPPCYSDCMPLVQFCTQVWLSSFSDAERWKHKFVELVARELPSGQFEN
ncbi:hypothetical protein LTS18_005169, partial [Coniosporium uncinatum]